MVLGPALSRNLTCTVFVGVMMKQNYVYVRVPANVTSSGNAPTQHPQTNQTENLVDRSC